MEKSILNLGEQVKRLPKTQRLLLRRLFAVSLSRGSLVVPDPMRGWIRSQFAGAAEELTEALLVNPKIGRVSLTS